MNDIAESVQAILDTEIRPMLQMHGGDLQLVHVGVRGEVRLRFVAACAGCILRPMTVAACVVPALSQVIEPEAIEIEGMTVPKAAIERARQNIALRSANT